MTPVRQHERVHVDRLLFGDNQFFGVNHRSEEKARAQAMQFQDLDAVMSVLDCAYNEGITTFMCTTHERIAEVADRIRSQPDRYGRFQFFPCMPYAHKYANAVTEHGALGALRQFLPEESLFSTALRSGRSLASKDIEGILTLLVDAEMAMFRGLQTPVVFLQNVVVDLLLGLRFDEAFAIFARHVRSRYGAEPGFITMNLPLLCSSLARVGLDDALVCTNLNKIGFRMPGGVEAYRSAMDEHPVQVIAMSVFASGAIPPREALEWVKGLDRVQSIVFGASSHTNVRRTRDLARELWDSAA